MKPRASDVFFVAGVMFMVLGVYFRFSACSLCAALTEDSFCGWPRTPIAGWVGILMCIFGVVLKGKWNK
jgi:hypothetical protein